MQRIEFDVDYGLNIDAKDIEKQINEQIKNENSKIKKILEGKSKEKLTFGLNVKNVIDDNGNPIDPNSLKQYTAKTEKALNTAFSEMMKQFRGKFKKELADELGASLSESISGMFDDFTSAFISEINTMKSEIINGISDGSVKIDMSQSIKVDNIGKAIEQIKQQGNATVNAIEQTTADIAKANADLEAQQEKARTSHKKMQNSSSGMLLESSGKGGKGVSKERVNTNLIAQEAKQYYQILEKEKDINDIKAQIESEKLKSAKIGEKQYSIEYFSQMKDDSEQLKTEIIDLLKIYNDATEKVDQLELDNDKLFNSLGNVIDEKQIDQAKKSLSESNGKINELNETIQNIVSVFGFMQKSKEELINVIGDGDESFDLESIFEEYNLSDNGIRNNLDELRLTLEKDQSNLKKLKDEYKKFKNSNMLPEDKAETEIKEASNGGIKAGVSVYPVLRVESFVKNVKAALDATRAEIEKQPLEIPGTINTLDLVEDVRIAMENSTFPLNIDENSFKAQIQNILNSSPLTLENVNIGGSINGENAYINNSSIGVPPVSSNIVKNQNDLGDDFDISDEDMEKFLSMPGIFDNINQSIVQMGDTTDNVTNQMGNDIDKVAQSLTELTDMELQFPDSSFHTLFEDADQEAKKIKTAYEIMMDDLVGNIDESLHNTKIVARKEIDEMLQYLNDFRKSGTDNKGRFKPTIESKKDKEFRVSLSDKKYDPYKKNADAILSGINSSQNADHEYEVLKNIFNIQNRINEAKSGQEVYQQRILKYDELCKIAEKDLTEEQKKSKDILSNKIKEYQTKYAKYLENEEQYVRTINELKQGTSFESYDKDSIALAAMKNQVKLSDEHRKNIDNIRKQYYSLVPTLQKISDLENAKKPDEFELQKLTEYRNRLAQGQFLQPVEQDKFEQLEQDENKFKANIQQANKELEQQEAILSNIKKDLSFFADKQNLSLNTLFGYVSDKSNNGKGISQAKAIKDNFEKLESIQNQGKYADEMKAYEDKYQKSVQAVTKMESGKLARLKSDLQAKATMWQKLSDIVNKHSFSGATGYNNRKLKKKKSDLSTVDNKINDLNRRSEKRLISNGDYEEQMSALQQSQKVLREEVKVLAARRTILAKFASMNETDAKEQIALQATKAQKTSESFNTELSNEESRNQIINKLRHNDIKSYSDYIKMKESLDKKRAAKRADQQLLDERSRELESQGYSKDEVDNLKWDAIGGKEGKNDFYQRNKFIQNNYSALQNVELDLNEIVRLMGQVKELQSSIESGELFGDDLETSKENLAILQSRLSNVLKRSGWTSTNDIYKYRNLTQQKDSQLNTNEYAYDHFTKGTSKVSEIVKNYDAELERLKINNSENQQLIDKHKNVINNVYEQKLNKNKNLRDNIDEKIANTEKELTKVQDLYQKSDDMGKLILDGDIDQLNRKLKFFQDSKKNFENPEYLNVITARQTEQDKTVKTSQEQITLLQSQITLNNKTIQQLKEQRDIQEEIRKVQEPTAEELEVQKSSKVSEQKDLNQRKKDADISVKNQLQELDSQIADQQVRLDSVTKDAEEKIIALRKKLVEAEQIGLELTQKNDNALQDVNTQNYDNKHSDLYNEYRDTSNKYLFANSQIQTSEKLLKEIIATRISNEKEYQDNLKKILELNEEINKNGFTLTDANRINELIKPNRSDDEEKEYQVLRDKQYKHFDLSSEMLEVSQQIGMTESVSLKTDEKRKKIYETIKVDAESIKQALTESEKRTFQNVDSFYDVQNDKKDGLQTKLSKLEKMQDLIDNILSIQSKLGINEPIEKYEKIQTNINELRTLSDEMNLPVFNTSNKQFKGNNYELLKDNMEFVKEEIQLVTKELTKQMQIEQEIAKINTMHEYRTSGEQILKDNGYTSSSSIKEDYINKIKDAFKVEKSKFDQMFVSSSSENGIDFIDKIDDEGLIVLDTLSKYIQELEIMVRDQEKINSIYHELGFTKDSSKDNLYEAISVYSEDEKEISKMIQNSKSKTAFNVSNKYYDSKQNISDLNNEIKIQEDRVRAEEKELSLLQQRKEEIVQNSKLEQSQYDAKIKALNEEQRQIEQVKKVLQEKQEVDKISIKDSKNNKSFIDVETRPFEIKEDQKVEAIAKVTEALKNEKVVAQETSEVLASVGSNNSKVESSAIETQTSLNQENISFAQVGVSAKEAAALKGVFAEANKAVEISAEASSPALEYESEQINDITKSADKAINQVYTLSKINQNIKNAKTDKTKEKWQNQAVVQGYAIDDNGFAKQIEETEIQARKQVEKTTQSIKEQNIVSVENKDVVSPIADMQNEAQAEIKETNGLIQNQINQAVNAAQVSIAEGSSVHIGSNVEIDRVQFDKIAVAFGNMNDISNKLLDTVISIYSAITSGSNLAVGSIQDINNAINTTVDSLEQSEKVVNVISAQIPKVGESVKKIAGNVNLNEYEDLNDAMSLIQESLLKKTQKEQVTGNKKKLVDAYDINSMLSTSDVKAKYYTKVGEDGTEKQLIDLTVKFKDLEGQVIQTTYTYDAFEKKLYQSGAITASISTAFSDQQNDIKKATVQLDYYSSVFDKLKIKYSNYKLNDFKLLDTGELEGTTENAKRILDIIPGSTKDMMKQVLSDMDTVSVKFNDFKQNVNQGIFNQDTFKTASNELNQMIENLNSHMNDVNRNINTSMEHISRNRLESWKNDISKMMNVPFMQDNFDKSGLNEHGLKLIDEYNKELKMLVSLYSQFKEQGNAFSDEQIQSWDRQITIMQELKKQVNGNMSKNYVNGLGASIDGISVSQDVFKTMATNASYARQVLMGLAKEINNTDVNFVKMSKDGTTLTYTFKDINGDVQTCKLSILDYGKTVRNTMVDSSQHVGLFAKGFDTLKDKLLQVTKYFSAYQIFYKVVNAVRSGIDIVKELDTAMTEMQKVSNDSSEALEKFAQTSHKIAQEVGSTAAVIQNSAADWMRLGFSVKEAEGLAKNTAILMNVSEFQDIGEATESMVAMIQAFKQDGMDAVQLSQDLIDKLNNIGNNYSISTSELAESLKRSSGTLIAANNSVDEAIALTTAGNAIIQDAESTGSALKVISMRIRGTSAKELEEAGEDTEGLIETTSKLADKIKSLTSINGGKGINILDDNGNYRSTYEILQDIADLWEQIGEQDKKDSQNRQAALLETLAGKTRAQALASILQNAEMLRSVYGDVQKSEGSAQQENEKYLDSIEAHLQILQAKWQELWDNTLARDQINFIIDRICDLLDIVKEIGLVWSSIFVGGALVGLNKLINLKEGGGRHKQYMKLNEFYIRNVCLKIICLRRFYP